MAIKRNYLLNLSNSLLNIVFPIITFRYAARILSPEGIGHTQVIFSYAQTFSLIAAIGIPIYGVKVISEDLGHESKLSKTTSELLILNVISVLICLLIYFLIGLQVPYFTSYRIELIIASVLLVSSAFNVDWYFAAKSQFKVILIRSIIVKGLSLLLLFSLVNDYSDRLWYLIFLIFIWVGNYLLNAFILFRDQKLTLNGIELTRHLKPLGLILSMTIATIIYTSLDTVILGILSDDTEVGLYTAGVKLTKVTIPILTSLGLVIIPKATALNLDGRIQAQHALYHKSFSLTALLAIPMSLGLFLLSYEAIQLFSGPAFTSAVTSMQILAFLPLFIGFGHMFSFQILVPQDIYRGMFWSTALGVILFASLAYLLMPALGSQGASISSLSTEVLVTIMYLVYVPKVIRVALPWKKVIYALLASIPFIPISYAVKSFGFSDLITLVLIIIISASSYLIIQKSVFKEPLVLDMIALLKSKMERNE
jgi:O-antigen/teichoic acid export membrane protein